MFQTESLLVIIPWINLLYVNVNQSQFKSNRDLDLRMTDINVKRSQTPEAKDEATARKTRPIVKGRGHK